MHMWKKHFREDEKCKGAAPAICEEASSGQMVEVMY